MKEENSFDKLVKLQKLIKKESILRKLCKAYFINNSY